MSVSTYIRGNKIKMEYANGTWCYPDGGEVRSHDIPCARCGKLATPEDHDACLGYIPGVRAACCGHGIHELMIDFHWWAYPWRFLYWLKGIKHENPSD